MFYLCAATSFRRFAESSRAQAALRWKQFSWQRIAYKSHSCYGYGRSRMHCNIERSTIVVGFKSQVKLSDNAVLFLSADVLLCL